MMAPRLPVQGRSPCHAGAAVTAWRRPSRCDLTLARAWRARLVLVICMAWMAALAGCATPKALSPGQAQAVALNRQGMDSFAGGDMVRAQQAFEAALQLERAVENEEGIAVNLLSLAQCQQRLGKPERAVALLDQVLDGGALAFHPRHRAEAALQHALLAFQRQDLAAAERWQRDGAAICGGCAMAGKLRALGARLALQRGDAVDALKAAGDALASSGDDTVEKANALRLQGAAHLALGQQPAAEAALLQALALDKDGGLPDKVLQDLQLLGHAGADPAVQRRYWRRALAVAQAIGKAAAVEEIERALSALPLESR
ncbi:MAG: tetratricopeptide repeat protein [Burkholderiaceae bacterium]|nr:tetratricopeptide repeat protein [Burkholderiaceae bacterium]